MNGWTNRRHDKFCLFIGVSALGLGLLAASPGHAGRWQWDELTASLDSTLTMSSSMRVQSRDCHQIATVNGGCNSDNSLFTQARLLNSDDGNLNYGKGQFFSVLAQASHEVQVDWRDYGAFVRFSYFGDALQAQRSNGDRTNLSSDARHRSSLLQSGVVGAHFYFLDAYAFATVDLWDRLFDFRVGNQVLNWGESTFQQGGINAISTLDVTKVRLAGSELREALLPAPIARISTTIFDQLSIEAYYQFVWRKNLIDPVGTFFSTNDLVSRGAQAQFSGASLLPEVLNNCGDPGTDDADRQSGANPCPTSLNGLERFPYGFPLLRRDDADDGGQWGVALRYYLDNIETEFAAYYIRLHDKSPTVSFEGSSLAFPLAGSECVTGASVPKPGCDMGYFVEYKNNIDLFGFSLNTVLADFAVGFEFSYRLDQPTPINTGDDVQALAISLVPVGPRGRITGMSREERLVAIANVLYIVGPGTPYGGALVRLLGASDMTILAEAAVTSYPDLELPRSAYIGPLGVTRPDSTGGGYQFRVSATYERAFGSTVTLTPVVAFRHDVKGITPPSEAAFNEDLKQISLSLEANYLERWKAVVSYSNSFSAGQRNDTNDRDFVGLSISYAL